MTVEGSSEATLAGIAARQNAERGQFSKPHAFYKVYERYFSSLRAEPLIIVELGVYEGESTRILSEYFPNAKILAVDIEHRADLSSLQNVFVHSFSQTDGDAWRRLLDEQAPGGVDVVLDDASHIGYFSQITFCHLFSRLKPGALYIAEDWSSGYLPHHPDGARCDPQGPVATAADFPMQIDSHSYGMVGFIKWLVDLQGSRDVKAGGGTLLPFGDDPLEFLHIYDGTAVARKRSA